MELKERLLILKKRVSLIILITLISTITSAVLSYFFIEPKYKTEISVIIGRDELQENNSGTNLQNVLIYQTLVKTYAKLTTSRGVVEDVIAKLKLKDIINSELLKMIVVTPDEDTQFLTITVTSKDPKQAMDIANQFAKSLKAVGVKVNKVDIVKLLEEAQLPTNPYSPKPILNIAIAFFVGLLFSGGLAFLLEYLDSTVKTKEDVEAVGLPVIGAIPLVSIEDKDVIIW